MEDLGFIVLVGVIAVIVVIAVSCIQIVPQAHSYVIERNFK